MFYGNKKKSHEQYLKELNKDKYELLSIYNGRRRNVTLRCKKCGEIIELRADHALDPKRGCPLCKTETKGEHLIRKFLESKNINFKTQIKFDDLLGTGGGHLSYDFGIYDKDGNIKVLLEYNGQQHYEYCPQIQKNYDKFEKQQEHDRRKKEYAKNHDIIFIELSYLLSEENIKKIVEGVVNNANYTL